MLLIPLLLFATDTIWLQSGRSLHCASFQRQGDTVIVRTGEIDYSLPEQNVDWQRTELGATEEEEPQDGPQFSKVPSAPKKYGLDHVLPENGPEYSGFIIQRLDVKQTSLIDLIRFLADMVGLNLYIDSSVQDKKVTYLFKNLPWDQVLTIILYNAGLDFELSPTFMSVKH